MSEPAAWILVPLLLAIALPGQARTPTVSDVEVAGRNVSLTVSWPNAWRNARNHDAAWLILRGPDATRGPLRLAADGHEQIGDAEPPVALQVSEDRLGVFVAPAAALRGDVSWRITLRLVEPAPETVTGWAVGMVYVPGGGFELGDDHPDCLRFGAFHGRDASGAPTVYPVPDEREIGVSDAAGALWYSTDPNGYRGDAGGPIPAAWPKGTRAFYVMKHELLQGTYAAFLTALPRAWQERRAPLELSGEGTATCSIRREGERFVAAHPDRPCNFVSWDDTSALYDWLALRPMTEFEFEKAARGPERPVPRDYPWGSSDDSMLARRVAETRDLTNASVADEATLTDDTRAKHGASHYWVMDLSGSLWERVVSAGHPAGRGFTGSHGDGVLAADGRATNADWPATVGDEAPGVGYRGGAEYFAPQRAGDPTNPHSPVAVRTYAGWGGADRYKTYSARGCRTAPAGR